MRRDQAVALLRPHGRVTWPRVSVLEHLAQAPEHLTAVEVHQALVSSGVTVNLSTIHRTLTSLLDSGIVHVVFGAKGASYGLSDLHHSHATCSTCGRTVDQHSELSPALLEVESTSELDLTDVSLCLIGVCGACRSS